MPEKDLEAILNRFREKVDRNHAGDPYYGMNKAQRAIAEFTADKPVLQSILRTASRPLSATANLAEAGIHALSGRGKDAMGSLKAAGGHVVDLAGDLVEGGSQVIDAALPGDVFPSNWIPDVTTPKDFRGFANVLETAGVPRGPAFDLPIIGSVTARGLAGFGLDIPLDPLNIGAGKIAAATRPAVESVRKFALTKTPLRHLSTGLPGTKLAMQKGRRIGGEASREMATRAAKIMDEAVAVAEAEGLPPDLFHLRMDRAIERKNLLPEEVGARRAARNEIVRRMREYTAKGFTRREASRAAYIAVTTGEELMAPYAGQSAALLHDMLVAERRAGVDVGALHDEALNYLSRVLTPEAWKALRGGGKFNDAHRFVQDMLKRQPMTRRRKAAYDGTMIPDINAGIETMLGDKFKYKLFEEDPAKILAARARQHGKAIGASEFHKTILDEFALDPTDANLEIAIPVDEMLKRSGLKPGAGPFAEHTGKVLPLDIADQVARTLDALTNPATPAGIMGHFVRLTNWFRAGVTAPFPAFHTRNGISIMWANYLAGMRNPSRYLDADALVRDLKKGGQRVWDEYNGMTSQQVWNVMEDSGAFQHIASKAELPGSEAKSLPGKVLASPITAGKAVGDWVENRGRIALFLDRVNKGADLDHALLDVKKYHFDYNDLSPIEKRLFKRVVPFWTFTRKNLPLQLESMITQPGKIANLAHAQRALQNRDTGGEGVDTTIIPHWVKRRLFGVERLSDGDVEVLSGLGIGFEDLAILDRPFDEFVAMLNPMVKAPLQGATNKDYFRDLPLDKSDYAPSLFRHMPKAFQDAIDFREVRDSSGEIKAFRANPRFLNAFFGMVVPGASRAANVATQLDPAVKFREGKPEPMLRNLTGIRRSTMSPQRQMQENARRALEKYVERLQELQREGVTYEIEDKFSVRRDLPLSDPRRREAREIQREISKASRALRRLSRTERAEMSREGLRSGGQ